MSTAAEGRRLDAFRLTEYFRPYAGQLFQLLAITVTTVVINFFVPITSKEIVDNGIALGDTTFITMMIALQVFLYMALIALHTVRAFLSTHVSARVTTVMVWSFFSHLLHLPLPFFEKTSVGDLLERIRDMERVQKFISTDVVDLIAALIGLASLAPLLAWIDLRLFFAFLASAVSYLGWVLLFRRIRKKLDDERFHIQSTSRAAEVHILSSISHVKLFGREHASLRNWESIQLRNLKARIKFDAIENWQESGGRLISRIGLIAITYLSATGVVNGGITIGEMTVTTVISLQLFYQVDQLLNFSKKFQDAMFAHNRISEVQALAVEDHDVAPHIRNALAPEALSISQVTFAYPKNPSRLILDGISFRVEPGTTVAIVGPSGSGKTTLLKLMLKLASPTRGDILIGDISLGVLPASQWRREVAAVMQDGVIFEDTVLGNIVGDVDPDQAWLEEVIAIACCEDFIDALPDGLLTRLGGDGIALSAGERQRLMVARAVYRRPRLLLMDEATSALDRDNEARLTQNLVKALPGVTKIVIAHRLETVRLADRIVVLDGGAIVEEGGHADLLRKGGLYAELFLCGR